jgi:hypothetical protein
MSKASNVMSSGDAVISNTNQRIDDVLTEMRALNTALVDRITLLDKKISEMQAKQTSKTGGPRAAAKTVTGQKINLEPRFNSSMHYCKWRYQQKDEKDKLYADFGVSKKQQDRIRKFMKEDPTASQLAGSSALKEEAKWFWENIVKDDKKLGERIKLAWKAYNEQVDERNKTPTVAEENKPSAAAAANPDGDSEEVEEQNEEEAEDDSGAL